MTREKAMRRVKGYLTDCLPADDYEEVEEIMKALEQEPIKGHWIEHPHEWGDNWQYSDYECNICHNWAHFDTDFCPNCGADMKEIEI